MKYSSNRIPWFKEKTIIKDSLIIVGWIMGIIILSGISWYFTQPIRSRLLINAVNQVLEQSGDHGRIIDSTHIRNSRSPGLGSWYNLSGNSRIYIFTFIGEGAFFPCAAIITAEGELSEFVSLNRAGRRILDRVSPDILQIYSQRIMGGS